MTDPTRTDIRLVPAAPPSTAPAPALAVSGLTLELGARNRTRRVVDDVSFTLGVGETLGLVGQSGSGKSMTAHTVMGLTRRLPVVNVSGSVRLGGRELIGLSGEPLRRIRGAEMAMIMQDPMSSLNPAFTVGQQIVQTLRAHRRMPRAAARRRAVDMLRLVEIPAAERRIDSYPHEFSGGMRQRVMLAMALSCEPRVLIADEPTTSLDVTIQAQMLDLLRRLQAELGMSILFITHDLGVVASICHKVAVMYAAQIVETAPVDSLFANVRHPYTELLLRSTPEYFSLDPGPAEDSARRSAAVTAAAPASGCRFRNRCAFTVDDVCGHEQELLPLGIPTHPVRCARAPELDLGAHATRTGGDKPS